MSRGTGVLLIKGVFLAIYITAVVFIFGYQHWLPIMLIIAGLGEFAFWLIRRWVR